MNNHAYLRHLANFVLTVEAGSMTGAAERMGGSPSAMSESVKILENYCGESLLERHRSGVVPTSTGLSLYGHAKDMSEAAAMALNLGSIDSPQHQVKISMPVELACGWFHSEFTALRNLPDAPQLSIGNDDSTSTT